MHDSFATMSSSTTESKTFKVADLVKLYQNGQIKKPRIQRKLRWTDKDNLMNRKYVEFAYKLRNTINPFLFNEKIMDGKKIYIVIDGNNRINAILMFVQQPLVIFPELIPGEYPDAIRNALIGSSLEYILKCRNFRTFCNDHGLLEWLVTESHNPHLDDPFEKLQDALHSRQFFDVTLPHTVFQNMTDEEIHNIYQSVNESGKKLTRQEILACTTDGITFHYDEIPHYNEIKKQVETYYNEMIASEKLSLEHDSLDSLNLFEVLLGFQSVLHEMYEFVPKPGDSTQLDIVFKLYEMLVGGFNGKSPVFAGFIHDLMRSCHKIASVYNSILNSNINYRIVKKNSVINMSENSLFILLVWLSKQGTGLDEKLLKRCLLYNDLISLVGEKEKRAEFHTNNPLHFSAGGSYVINVAKHILSSGHFSQVPTDDHVRALLLCLCNEHVTDDVEKPKKRTPMSRFQTIVLAMYYNAKVPLDLLAARKHLDHIVPYSIDTRGLPIDLERLGNKMLIDEATNLARGTKAITKAFIDSHALHYHNYPTEEDYQAITTDGKTLTSLEMYNTVCERRERAYIDLIVGSL